MLSLVWKLARSVADVLPRPTRRLVLVSGADPPQASHSVVDALEFDLSRWDSGFETASLPPRDASGGTTGG